MTSLTFDVCALSFAANMVMKQNTIDHMAIPPGAAQIVLISFCVEDGVMGADSIQNAKQLREELQELFNQGGINLRKWKSNEQEILDSIPLQMRDVRLKQEIAYNKEFMKVLGVEWNAAVDSFCPVTS